MRWSVASFFGLRGEYCQKKIIFKKNLKDYYDNLPDRLSNNVNQEQPQPNRNEYVIDEFTAYFNFLTTQGYDPSWDWNQNALDNYNRFPGGPDSMGTPAGSSSILPGRIKCTNGPIRSIDFKSTTTVIREEGPTDKPKDPVEWKTENEICFTVSLDWETDHIPGLNMLFIQRSADHSLNWSGNDMGLGIIDKLNANGLLSTIPKGFTITARTGLRPFWDC